jgi:hypothetical protein
MGCFRFPGEATNFSPLRSVQTGREAHPASYSPDTGALSPGVKRLGREAAHSPPPSGEVKNDTSTSPYSFIVSCINS